jgi:hypothetical protein
MPMRGNCVTCRHFESQGDRARRGGITRHHTIIAPFGRTGGAADHLTSCELIAVWEFEIEIIGERHKAHRLTGAAFDTSGKRMRA